MEDNVDQLVGAYESSSITGDHPYSLSQHMRILLGGNQLYLLV